MEVIAVAAGVLLLIGFICGYGVRARLRRAKAERRRFERMVEEVAQKQERLAITFQRLDGTQAPLEGGVS